MQLNKNAGTTATYTRLEYRQWIMAPRIYRVQIQGSLEDPFWGPVEKPAWKNRAGRIREQASQNVRPVESARTGPLCRRLEVEKKNPRPKPGVLVVTA